MLAKFSRYMVSATIMVATYLTVKIHKRLSLANSCEQTILHTSRISKLAAIIDDTKIKYTYVCILDIRNISQHMWIQPDPQVFWGWRAQTVDTGHSFFFFLRGLGTRLLAIESVQPMILLLRWLLTVPFPHPDWGCHWPGS